MTLAAPVAIHKHVNGIVRTFDVSIRTGVIVSDYGDLLVRSEHILKRPPVLSTGQLVTFNVCDGPEGLHAVDVLLSPSQDISHVSESCNLNFRTSATREAPVALPTSTTTASPTDEGIDPSRFKSNVPDEFVCSICHGVLNEPVQTACYHLFCRRCINVWLEKTQNCPQDRKPLQPADVGQVPPYLKSLIGGLKLHCDFADRGCSTVVTIDQLENHVSSCRFRETVPQWREEESEFSIRVIPTAPSFAEPNRPAIHQPRARGPPPRRPPPPGRPAAPARPAPSARTAGGQATDLYPDLSSERRGWAPSTLPAATATGNFCNRDQPAVSQGKAVGVEDRQSLPQQASGSTITSRRQSKGKRQRKTTKRCVLS